MAETDSGTRAPPELDDALYRLEVLQLPAGQRLDDASDDHGDGNGDDDDNDDDGEDDDSDDDDQQMAEGEKDHRDGCGGNDEEAGAGIPSERIPSIRSDSVTTVASSKVRSVSPSIASHSTMATSRSSQDSQQSHLRGASATKALFKMLARPPLLTAASAPDRLPMRKGDPLRKAFLSPTKALPAINVDEPMSPGKPPSAFRRRLTLLSKGRKIKEPAPVTSEITSVAPSV